MDPAHEMAHDHAPAGGRETWRLAVAATLHCLTGCAIGEVLGMVIATAIGLGNAASIVLSIVLAFAFGYGLTIRPLLAVMSLRRATRLALASDTVSITTMEIVDNLFIVAVPGRSPPASRTACSGGAWSCRWRSRSCSRFRSTAG